MLQMPERVRRHREMIRRFRTLPPNVADERWRTARHEAGHVVGALDTGVTPILARVGRDRERGTAGCVSYPVQSYYGAAGFIGELVQTLAALYAENRGNWPRRQPGKWGWHHDARDMEAVFRGLSRSNYNHFLLTAHMRARGLVVRRRLDILRIAKRLETKRVWRP